MFGSRPIEYKKCFKKCPINDCLPPKPNENMDCFHSLYSFDSYKLVQILIIKDLSRFWFASLGMHKPFSNNILAVLGDSIICSITAALLKGVLGNDYIAIFCSVHCPPTWRFHLVCIWKFFWFITLTGFNLFTCCTCFCFILSKISVINTSFLCIIKSFIATSSICLTFSVYKSDPYPPSLSI